MAELYWNRADDGINNFSQILGQIMVKVCNTVQDVTGDWENDVMRSFMNCNEGQILLK